MAKKKHGAVLVFKDGVDVKLIVKELARLYRDGLTEKNAEVRTFDPEYGGPVWYVP